MPKKILLKLSNIYFGNNVLKCRLLQWRLNQSADNEELNWLLMMFLTVLTNWFNSSSKLCIRMQCSDKRYTKRGQMSQQDDYLGDILKISETLKIFKTNSGWKVINNYLILYFFRLVCSCMMENIVGKEEIAHHEQFLLFPQGFLLFRKWGHMSHRIAKLWDIFKINV